MKPAQGLGTTSLPKALNTGNISTFKPLHSKSAAVNSNLGAAVATGQPAKPLWQHDPHTEGAVILNHAQWKQAGDKHGVTPVVVDPYIGRKLRPHQCHGVQFLYECVMGLREANRQVWVSLPQTTVVGLTAATQGCTCIAQSGLELMQNSVHLMFLVLHITAHLPYHFNIRVQPSL